MIRPAAAARLSRKTDAPELVGAPGRSAHPKSPLDFLDGLNNASLFGPQSSPNSSRFAGQTGCYTARLQAFDPTRGDSRPLALPLLFLPLLRSIRFFDRLTPRSSLELRGVFQISNSIAAGLTGNSADFWPRRYSGPQSGSGCRWNCRWSRPLRSAGPCRHAAPPRRSGCCCGRNRSRSRCRG